MARRDRDLEATEDMLDEAWACMARLPDRERGWQGQGTMSWWPTVLRDPITDYPGDDEPRMPLGRREVALVADVFDMTDGLVMLLSVDQRRLLAIVLVLRGRARMSEQFWPDVLGVWRRMPGNAKLGTSDGLRMRYARMLQRLARADAVRRDGAARVAA